ncbi:DUF4133 domain-containing protein [Chryseobacterium kwangjuense]|uniref:Conjugal transfer protein TraF n=1 Tax=Chryseobacterium kwangjuense TaxID=267125 RepID=A0A135WJ44_9FLAO|nr:DUF4133 domain-containing protein [Chryseobacterium kwangjuense]KXH84921.1 conjugal transfer protein TraF [Chryseobacterium kwangjuense]
MNKWNINKGIGRTVEFKGLKAQYLFVFAGGLLTVLILVMIMYMVGMHMYFCLGFGIGAASLIIWKTFALNKKYGEHGLMKLGAKRSHPKYIVCRKPLFRHLKGSFTAKNEANGEPKGKRI